MALDHFTRAVISNPVCAEGYSKRGLAFYATNRLERALADWEAAVRLDPSLSKKLASHIKLAQDGMGKGA